MPATEQQLYQYMCLGLKGRVEDINTRHHIYVSYTHREKLFYSIQYKNLLK